MMYVIIFILLVILFIVLNNNKANKRKNEHMKYDKKSGVSDGKYGNYKK